MIKKIEEADFELLQIGLGNFPSNYASWKK